VVAESVLSSAAHVQAVELSALPRAERVRTAANDLMTLLTSLFQTSDSI
jgi:hypothetical protein